MSIKCYEAYRFMGRSDELIPSLLAWKLRLYRRMRHCFYTLLPRKDQVNAFDKVIERAKAESIEYKRNEFDYEIGVKLYQPSKRYTILMPAYEHMNEVATKSFSFLRKEPCLKDFKYWNNTDGPDDVSNKEWQLRRRVYQKIDHPVYVSFMNYSSLYLASPYLSDREEFDLGDIRAIH